MTQKDYLLDTNIIRYICELELGIKSKESLALKKRLKSLPSNSSLFLSSITLGEVEYGVRVGPFRNDESDKYISLMTILNRYHSFDLNSNVARDYYAELRSRLYKKYASKSKKEKRSDKKRIEEWNYPTTSLELQIQENDVWITAIAWAYNLILVTNDEMTPIKNVVGDEIEFENWLRQ